MPIRHAPPTFWDPRMPLGLCHRIGALRPLCYYIFVSGLTRCPRTGRCRLLIYGFCRVSPLLPSRPTSWRGCLWWFCPVSKLPCNYDLQGCTCRCQLFSADCSWTGFSSVAKSATGTPVGVPPPGVCVVCLVPRFLTMLPFSCFFRPPHCDGAWMVPRHTRGWWSLASLGSQTARTRFGGTSSPTGCSTSSPTA